MRRTIYLLFTIFYLLFAVPSYAQTIDEFSIGIYPPVLEITADPPAKIKSAINIQNLTENMQNLSILFRPFRLSSDGTGRLEYFGQDNEIIGPDPLILQKVRVYEGETPIYSVLLNPLESKDLTLKIDLEQEAPVGDYYFSVIFLSQSESADSSGSTIQFLGGIGTNVILSVGKKGPTRGEILDFKVPLFVSYGPVPFTLLLRNNSNHYIVPRGRISIKDMFGRDVGKIEILPQYILSNSERYMIDSAQAKPSTDLEKMIAKLSGPKNALIWQERFLLGLYTANAHIKLEPDGPVFDTTINFFAIPLYIVFAISFFVFVLLGIYLRAKKKI